ncbi:MAG: TatD family hydrolase [Deltaproteobacteria bacterium]|nr:TatD family hydrolase [Deltaproteobacteria bacterium]
MIPKLDGVIDSHCHVPVSGHGGRAPREPADDVLSRARAAGVRGFVVVGVGETTLEARDAIGLAQRHPDVVASVGVHPHDARLCDDTMVDELRALARDPRVAAVGEIGLDFHYDHSPRDQQRAVFRRFVGVARELGKPIVIHTRSAGQEVLEILEQEGARDLGGVIHCFSEDLPFARRALDLGFDLSFSGIVTFKTATAIHEVGRFVPKERYLVETDAPYLAPVPLRGKLCEPAYVVYTARHLAELRGVAPEDVARESSDNARRRFAGLG